MEKNGKIFFGGTHPRNQNKAVHICFQQISGRKSAANTTDRSFEVAKTEQAQPIDLSPKLKSPKQNISTATAAAGVSASVDSACRTCESPSLQLADLLC